jgi:PAS domain S-box-containing protein
MTSRLPQGSGARRSSARRRAGTREPSSAVAAKHQPPDNNGPSASWLVGDGELAALVDSAVDAIIVEALDGTIIRWNHAAERLYGYTAAEAVGESVSMIVPPGHAYEVQAIRERIGSGSAGTNGHYLETVRVAKDGRSVDVELTISPVHDTAGELIGAGVIARDIGERKRFEHDLREANERLEAANRTTSRFLASMSHELRTPLNAILGFTGTMLMGLPGPLNAEQTAQLGRVQTGGRHLLSLINDLLDLARIESGNVELKVESIDCQELLEEVALGLRPLADAKGLKLAVITPTDRFEVRSDRRAVSQILINLTSNAIKFTHEGEVRLQLSRQDGERSSITRFTVTDAGEGIKVADQERLFAAFEQIESSSTRPQEGTGLGLFICQNLAAFIGATITFDSEFGIGSAFTLALAQ